MDGVKKEQTANLLIHFLVLNINFLYAMQNIPYIKIYVELVCDAE